MDMCIVNYYWILLKVKRIKCVIKVFLGKLLVNDRNIYIWYNKIKFN